MPSPHANRSPLPWVFGWIVLVFALGFAAMPHPPVAPAPSTGTAARALEERQSAHWRNVSFLAFIPPAGLLGLRVGRARGRRGLPR